MNIGFIGLGKLGLPCAEQMARKHNVYGYDVRAVRSDYFKTVGSIAEAVIGRDLVFVAVPTPHSEEYDGQAPIASLPTKDFDYGVVCEVLSEIKKVAEPQQTIVLISTVLPGTTRRLFAPNVENLNLIYNPYFIAMGTVEQDFLNPEFMPIGTRDGDAGLAKQLIEFYSGLIANLKFSIGTWEEMEATKIFYNTFISFKLSFVNMIQDVAERVGHMNVDVVTDALCNSQGRLLSPAYMKAGMGDGGPCHPRDNIALSALAEKLNLNYDLYRAIMEARERQAENMARTLLSYKKKVIILGKSFKPGVALVDGSYSVLVGHFIQKQGGQLGFVDRNLNVDDDCDRLAKTYLLAHNDKSWHSYNFRPGSIIVDPWRSGLRVESCEVMAYGNTRKAH